MNKTLCSTALLMALYAVPGIAGVNKVYNTNVEQGEVEVEMRGIHALESETHKFKLGTGYGVSANWFIEGYLIGEKEDGGNFEVEEAEIESKFRLTEQGEHWADFALLVELEKKLDHDVWEIKAGPIIQKQFGSWVATANILFEQKFGSDVGDSDLETLGSLQLKYRMGETLEPGIEYYGDEDSHLLGPVLLGSNKLFDTKTKWELGVLFGMNDTSENAVLRWNMEWEF